MQILLSFIPLVFMLALYASYVKLAAIIFRRASVSWKNSFIFSFLVVLITIVVRFSTLESGHSLPIIIGVVFGFTINLLLGGWFFSSRAKDTQGQLFGWGRGMVLSAIISTFLVATAFALMGVVHVLMPQQP